MELSLYKYYLKSKGISIDSRNVNSGDIFFGLAGVRYNGGKFSDQAINKGASYVVVDKKYFKRGDDRYIYSENPLKSLQNLALEHRNKFDIPIIAITGSSGKTTTKELLSLVLNTTYKVHFNKGNLNSHIGVPLTLLSMPLNTEIAVIEMGARGSGEILELCNIVKPTHGLITNIKEVHLEGFGDIKGVLKSKTELFRYLYKNRGSIFINSKDELLKNAAKLFHNPIDFSQECQVVLSNEKGIVYKDNLSHIIQTKLLGNFNIDNISAASRIGRYFKINQEKINQVIKKYTPYTNRLQIVKKESNTILLDAYNSNLPSVKEAFKVFENIEGKTKVLILGDMEELGVRSKEYHGELVSLTNSTKYEKVILCGPKLLEKKINNPTAIYFKNKQDLETYLKSIKFINSSILVKASRSFQFETLVNSF